jgi:polyisoprenoid-binding protein YceI
MRRALLFLIALGLFATARDIDAAEFVVRAGEPNKVVFTSKAATETFDGKTSRMRGRIVVDPSTVGDSVTVHLEVDMASLDTGIGKRNQHMRENHLETETYPLAVFDGASVLAPTDAALVVGKPVSFEVEGSFTLHGVTKRLRASVEVALRDERTLEFSTAFKVTLADYRISRPKFLFLKLGETQAVSVTGVATRTP